MSARRGWSFSRWCELFRGDTAWLELIRLLAQNSIAASFGLLGTLYQERLYRAHVAKRGPEARLYASLVGGLVFPAGAFILAFSQGRGHWMGPVVGLVLIFFGTYTIYVASFAYLADCYTIVSLLAFPTLEERQLTDLHRSATLYSTPRARSRGSRSAAT